MRKLLALLLLINSTVYAEIYEREIEYQSDGLNMKGFVVYDDSVSGQRPGILVVHEWWGHNSYARKRARMLAESGYTALAVDMYGEGKQADHPKDAGKFSGEVKKNMAVAEARFLAARDLLAEMENVNSDNISAIGYCFGGGIVLEMARRGADLDLVASYHGSLGTTNPAAKGGVKAKLLVFNGAADPFVKAEQIEAFKSEMDGAGVDYTFVNYEGAKHSFTNPDADEYGARFDLPLAYNAPADQQSWQATLKTLAEIYR